MIFFLYGEDTYRSKQKLNELVNHYKETHKSGLNLKYFEGKNLSFDDVKSEIQVIPMFKEKKFFIFTDVFSNKEFKEEFSKNYKIFIGSDNTVVFHEKKGKFPKDPFFAFLKKHAKFQEFEPLAGQKIRAWLKKEFEKRGARCELMAIEQIINFAGNDLWQLANEVDKLSAFKRGGEITAKDVQLLVKPKIETDIFKTIDAIGQKNKKQALTLLHKHLEKGDNPLYLLSMITFQLRNILIIKDLTEKGESLSKSGLHPFVVQKSSQQAQRFTFEELKKIYQNIFQADYKIKTGKIDSQLALDLLISDL